MNYKNLKYDELQEWFSDMNFRIKPFKHQLASVAFSLGSHQSRVMFIHGIGTGKTLSSLILTQCWQPHRILVICPNTIIKTWREEIEKFTDYSYCILSGSKEDRIQKLMLDHSDIFIINYEGLKLIGADRKDKKYKVNSIYAKSYGFDCVILDEIHHTKNPNSLQTKIAHQIAQWSRYVIGMTGTPIGKSVMDLFGQYLVLDNGMTFGKNYGYFLYHYFYKLNKMDWEWKVKKICNKCGELYSQKKEHLKKHNLDLSSYRKIFPDKEKTSEDIILNAVKPRTIQYTRNECIDLPEKIYEIKEVCMTKEQQKMTIEVINGIKIKELNEKNVEYHTQKLVQITGGHILHGNKKQYLFPTNPKLIELLDVVDQMEGKFIIYHYYIKEAEIIQSTLLKKGFNTAIVNGTVKNKDEQIDRFIQNDKCNVLIAHPRSGGEGLNLQIANSIIYYSRGYIGTILREQSEGRIWRAGQKNKNCLFLDIIMKSSIDEILFHSAQSRQNRIKLLLEYLEKPPKQVKI